MYKLFCSFICLCRSWPKTGKIFQESDYLELNQFCSTRDAYWIGLLGISQISIFRLEGCYAWESTSMCIDVSPLKVFRLPGNSDCKAVVIQCGSSESLPTVHHSNCDQLPQLFNNYFSYIKVITSRQTRKTDKNDLYLPLYKTKRAQKSIKYTGVKIWNDISLKIKTLPFNKFKQKYKLYLFQKSAPTQK